MRTEAMRYLMSRGANPGAITPSSNDYEDDSRHKDRLLDEALKDTFPASDPPSIIVSQ
jgi:hypothetical protein